LLIVLCLNILINTCFYLPEPIVITVKEDSDVVLPCSLSTKDITSKVYDWKKVAQKDDCQKEVFYYNGGIDHKNCFPGQVSHFPDELKHGNASIIFRNAKVTDSGVYTCDFPNLQPLYRSLLHSLIRCMCVIHYYILYYYYYSYYGAIFNVGCCVLLTGHVNQQI
uniref:Ig-like domain-containing protein n=1 Tax=Sander lucioperca TaxID=283035 RepID=A0A8C9Y460_SANLU